MHLFCGTSWTNGSLGKTVLLGHSVILQLLLLDKQDVNVIKIQPIDIMVDSQTTQASLPARCHAFSLCAAIETDLQCLKEADIVNECIQEATQWVSPLVPVRKSNGTLRLCVDYQRVNHTGVAFSPIQFTCACVYIVN